MHCEIIKVKAANYKIWDFNNSTVPDLLKYE